VGLIAGPRNRNSEVSNVTSRECAPTARPAAAFRHVATVSERLPITNTSYDEAINLPVGP
jgi:hypothetical protein